MTTRRTREDWGSRLSVFGGTDIDSPTDLSDDAIWSRLGEMIDHADTLVRRCGQNDLLRIYEEAMDSDTRERARSILAGIPLNRLSPSNRSRLLAKAEMFGDRGWCHLVTDHLLSEAIADHYAEAMAHLPWINVRLILSTLIGNTESRTVRTLEGLTGRTAPMGPAMDILTPLLSSESPAVRVAVIALASRLQETPRSLLP